MAILALLVVYGIFCVLAGILAYNKRRSEIGWVVLVLLFSPLVILILLALQPLAVETTRPTSADEFYARKTPAGISPEESARRFARFTASFR